MGALRQRPGQANAQPALAHLQLHRHEAQVLAKFGAIASWNQDKAPCHGISEGESAGSVTVQADCQLTWVSLGVSR